MVKKRSVKKTSRRRKESVVKVEKTSIMPKDIYEEWLKKQIIKPVETRGEVQVPVDMYEDWLKIQTVKPVQTKTEVQVPMNEYEKWIREQVKKYSASV